MTAAMGNCEKALCEQKCRKENPIISKGGHCTEFRYCECDFIECDDETCFQHCVTKDPELFKGGHCRWGWCKCDTQAWRQYVIKRIFTFWR